MTLSRVVIADDLNLVLDAVTALLRESFDVVATVSNGRTALKTILALDPDIAVLDVSMPEMNGVAVGRELKKRVSHAKIVFLTGHEDPAILESCQEAGGLGYVLKGSMDRDLITAMNEALAGRTFVSQFSSRRDKR